MLLRMSLVDTHQAKVPSGVIAGLVIPPGMAFPAICGTTPTPTTFKIVMLFALMLPSFQRAWRWGLSLLTLSCEATDRS